MLEQQALRLLWAAGMDHPHRVRWLGPQVPAHSAHALAGFAIGFEGIYRLEAPGGMDFEDEIGHVVFRAAEAAPAGSLHKGGGG